MEPRQARQHQTLSATGNKPGDQRHSFQIDRDRLLYCDDFRRLAQVTQVASAHEGHVFHNRLTHTLKVAQVGRRLAEKLVAEQLGLASELGGIEPDVVEAAALAHDLGHPPFGHMAERQLDQCARQHGLSDGFEGNAQSFRIVTKLAIHRLDYPGLNLTRATLNALLKYPWRRDRTGETTGGKRWRKYSVYDQDEAAFRCVRPHGDDRQTVEASLMDFADDLTYSIHDLEDFYLAGLIPLSVLATDHEKFAGFVAEWLSDRPQNRAAQTVAGDRAHFQQFLDKTYNLCGKYGAGSVEQRAHIQQVSSQLIQTYISSVKLSRDYGPDGFLQRQPAREAELKLLQRIVWTYAIANPRLATQKYGQSRIIKTLFDIYLEAVMTDDLSLIPARFGRELRRLRDRRLAEEAVAPEQVRLVVDLIASLSEAEAVAIYRRFLGITQGSVLDYLD
ncbi:MAG: dNTP triphosphohydrolase [Spirulinaceae cyanobacterium SM2_1_0]|nr:dNTP triphosphohydrolase [Spirulinaceae cyanobacterium SM2_1_0]